MICSGDKETLDEVEVSFVQKSQDMSLEIFNSTLQTLEGQADFKLNYVDCKEIFKQGEQSDIQNAVFGDCEAVCGMDHMRLVPGRLGIHCCLALFLNSLYMFHFSNWIINFKRAETLSTFSTAHRGHSSTLMYLIKLTLLYLCRFEIINQFL